MIWRSLLIIAFIAACKMFFDPNMGMKLIMLLVAVFAFALAAFAHALAEDKRQGTTCTRDGAILAIIYLLFRGKK